MTKGIFGRCDIEQVCALDGCVYTLRNVVTKVSPGLCAIITYP
jgi:hypothetical protein